nr:nitrile hydratase subunit beta [uncultured Shimia sp.]
MTRVHDMGGRFGDGPVEADDSATFDKEWHKRALALTLAAGALGRWNIDSSRHARECLSPKDYSRFSYYEKWMAALADLLVDRDLVTLDELKSGHGHGTSDAANKALRAQDVAKVLASGSPYTRACDVAQQFSAGARVTTRRPAGNALVDGGHSRLPAYAAGATGTVVICHGGYVLPDANGHYLGDQPEPLYAVAFEAQDLWGAQANAQDEVILDIWQSYLGPAE